MVQRTRSLMQRIRRMRDNPNVPVGSAPDGYFSDTHATSRDREHYAGSPWVTKTPGPRIHVEPPIIETPGSGANGIPASSRPIQHRTYTQQTQVLNSPTVPTTPNRPTHTRGTSREQNNANAASPIHPNMGYRRPTLPATPGPRSPTSPDEPFVMVDKGQAQAAAREKALPLPPGTQSLDDVAYYNRVAPGPNPAFQNGGQTGGATGIGRKVSLYRKVKDAVVGGGGGAKY